VNETRFYDDLDGVRHSIDLKAYEENRRIIVHEVTLAETESLRKQFGQDILEKLDAGEAELLAVLVSRPFDEYLICSADRIVYRVLGALKISEQGISLEEVLKAIGTTKNTEYPYIKAFREQWSRKGFEEGMTGLSFL